MSSKPRIGYVPFSRDLGKPGDRRRFVAYAQRRNLKFEIAAAGETYDLLVLSQSADVSLWVDYRGGKVVYDLIDSYLAIPRSDLKQLLRAPAKYVVGQFKHLRFDYKGLVQDMCRRADAVICTTEEQQRCIEQYCANVHMALDFHSSVARQHKTDYSVAQTIRIVWEGLGVNVSHLALLKDVLRSVAASTDLTLVVVTDIQYFRWLNKIGRVRTEDVVQRLFQPVSVHAWNEDSCASIVCSCDIGVIPLDLTDPFVAGKPENKLLLMWRMGMPVVSSATPAYARAMNAAGTPALACRSADDWLKALRTLVADEEARRAAGTAGREFANQAWGEAALLARWDRAMASIGIEVK